MEPLNADEELVWRSLMRLVFTLPRALGEDLHRSCGLSSTEYSVLMHLSESPSRRLRMSDLADRTSLSQSRITRVVDDMAKLNLVERRRGTDDGRTAFAVLTEAGLATLKRAWPHHLRSVRENALNHLTAEQIHVLAPILSRLVEASDSEPAPDETKWRS